MTTQREHDPYDLRYVSRLAAVLRARREELGLTQVEVGNAIGRTQHSVSRIEHHRPGSPTPAPEILNPWAKALNMTVLELLSAAGYAVDEDVAALLKAERERLYEMITRALNLSPEADQALRDVLARVSREPAT